MTRLDVASSIGVKTSVSSCDRCDRCRRYLPDVVPDTGLCGRCTAVVA